MKKKISPKRKTSVKPAPKQKTPKTWATKSTTPKPKTRPRLTKAEGARRFAVGQRGERIVAADLAPRALDIIPSPGSRTAVDMQVIFRNFQRWAIQVKTSEGGSPAALSSQEQGELLRLARVQKARPILAQVLTSAPIFAVARSYTVRYLDPTDKSLIEERKGVKFF